MITIAYDGQGSSPLYSRGINCGRHDYRNGDPAGEARENPSNSVCFRGWK